MIVWVANRVALILVQRDIVETEDWEVYAFGFECLLATLLQAAILLAAGLALGVLLPLFCFSVAFTMLKQNIGGWHADSHWACFLSTTGMSVGAVLLAERLPDWSMPFFLAAAWFLVVFMAPIPHRNNPKTAEETARTRSRALWLLSLSTAVCCFLSLHPYPWANCATHGAAGLCLAALSLIPARISKRKEGYDAKEQGSATGGESRDEIRS